jgi:small multidrug resistance pump
VLFRAALLLLSLGRHGISVIDALKGARAPVSSQIRDEAPMAWIYLTTAIVLEVAGITAMKLSRGFSEVLPSTAAPMLHVLSGAAVILALKRLELGVTYAVWSGVGTALAAIIGTTYFREPATLIKAASLGLVILGVVGLSLAARHTG